MTKIIPLLCFLFIFDKMPFVAKKSQRFHNSSISFCRSRKRQTGFLEPAAQLNEVMLNADKEKHPIKNACALSREQAKVLCCITLL